MAYQSYRRRNKRVVKKQMTLRKAAGQTLQLASKAGVSYLRRKLGLNTEKHRFDTVTTATTLGLTLAEISNPLIIPISDLTTGRTGDTIRLTRYELRLRLINSITETSSHVVRLIIAKYNNTGGNAIANLPLESGVNIASPRNNDATGMNILYDEVHNLTTVGGGQNIKYINFNYTPAAHHVKYVDTNTTGVYSALLDGYFSVYAMYDSTASVTAPLIAMYERVYFVDN